MRNRFVAPRSLVLAKLTILAVWLLWSPVSAPAQTADADIVGKIVDSQGAVVAGAGVSARNDATGFTRATVTQDDGLYSISGLPPGTYTLTVSATGFQDSTVRNLQLSAGAVATQDVAVAPAGVTETVTVTADVQLVEPSNPSPHAVITQKQIDNLPLNGRNFLDLALLTPGVDVDDTEEEQQDAAGQIQFAAQPSRNTMFVVDGADTTTEGFGGNQVFFSQDAIQEFRVLPANWPAEFGRTNAGVVHVVTKSGTNELHGTAFGFFRDKNLNARGRFETEKPDFSRQQFGGTVGGPIIKDRTFFFSSYEHQRQREFGTVNTFGTFPTEEGTFDQPVDNDLALAKVTHQVTDAQRLSVKYALDHRRDRNAGVGGTRGFTNGGNDDEYRQHVVVNDSWVINPRLINEFTASIVNRHSRSFRTVNTPELFYPSITLGGNNDVGVDFLERKGDIRDDLIFIFSGRGQHTMKFGYEFIDATDTGPYALFLPGAFFFASDTATIPDFGLVADNVFDEGNRIANHGLYVQDEWRLGPHFTVNMGLRYDVQVNALNEHQTLPVSDRLGLPRPKTDKDNFAPRLGFAWDLKGDGNSVIRGGAGIYYDQILPNIPFLEILANSGTSVFFVIAPSDLNDPINSSIFAENTGPTTSLDVLSPDFQTPYVQMQSIGVSRWIARTFAVDLDYVHARGLHEFYNRPINFNPGGPLPFPGFGRIRQFETTGKSDYNALEAKVTGRVGARTGMLVSYTLADATNFADDFRRQPPSDPFNIAAEKARSGTVARHRFVASGYVGLPADFLVAGILTARSGQPFNIILGTDANGDGFNQDRPADLARNSGDGPDFFSLDVRVVKSFRFAASRELQLIWEAFNLTNHVNFNDPIRILGSPNVGQFTEALAPRQMQLAVRFTY